ncbi:MAG TPA: sugar kinase [Elusimicrobia bacterium]|nr:MAG: sugar kinase [Elusimicrobia bacterium RIFOXYA12_FULL_49_49]OGS09215.1 MAG: sugar kinase [Elusimicrobia bacterium RIFOXYA1_FULL_47_7]OGS11463.1 MAG: sugar kinase [Elusimicrobia bacterium RIFOXYB1_FULL_48_9]OGS15843.1 MAG: sugar kinase [Elusimicrobia bacterium RIFOXYA2_FULL_47_53]OGS27137.1 MAG: sugar kinase [Elusimicrobia bacterium RIFOXYB12_FULL_50_12]OGS31175.1 MAG: sugar kinase [Elusimicrobia bacterium RIFOXYB2_FULL_46_23]HBU70158.1 sugar kinase [Elusimicrobiota bacterium]
MSILVVGSVAMDSVKTPFGKIDNALGGSATYFSVSASYFSPVKLVAVIGEDFPKKYLDVLKKHDIDLSGLQKVKGKTFRWKGQYTYDLNQAETLDTQLNVFAHFSPNIPEQYKKSEYVFLGNIDPELQLEVLKQVKNPKLVACDTMNYWISSKKPQLIKTLKKVDILVINEAEVRELAGESNLVKASKKIFSWGPKALVIKRGEYGALFVGRNHIFSAPAYPLEKVFDPTGAGDSFAGGFMGYLAKCRSLEDHDLRRAIVFGSVMASFNVEDFSLNKLRSLDWEKITDRFHQFKKLTHFEVLK